MTFSARFAIEMAVAVLLYFLPGMALAASGGHGGDAGLGWGFLFKVVNFAIICGLLFYVARKQLPAFLNQRRQQVAEALEQARKSEEQAHRLLKEYDDKLNRLGVEIEQMLNAAREQAEAERARILAAAKKDAAELLAAAERSAENMEAQMQLELRKLFADKVARLAEEKAKATFLGNDAQKHQDRLLQEFLQEVGGVEGG